MEQEKCIVHDIGDPSVGIQSQTWVLDCPFHKDEEKENIEFFRSKIYELYSEFSESRVYVSFSFESDMDY
jgi:hypothetical protein